MVSHVRLRLSTDLSRTHGWERILGVRGFIDGELCPRDDGGVG
jgi:hypothetical protein